MGVSFMKMKTKVMKKDMMLMEGVRRKEAGDIPGEHFVYEDAEGPPINGLVVTLAEDDFGRDVFGRAAHGPCSVGMQRRR